MDVMNLCTQVCTFLLENDALWVIFPVPCGICERGLFRTHYDKDRRETCAVNVVSWRRHQMETFLRCWHFRGIHRSPVNSPHKGQWLGALTFSLICAWFNAWVNSREASDLRRHRLTMTLLQCMNPPDKNMEYIWVRWFRYDYHAISFFKFISSLKFSS